MDFILNTICQTRWRKSYCKAMYGWLYGSLMFTDDVMMLIDVAA